MVSICHSAEWRAQMILEHSNPEKFTLTFLAISNTAYFLTNSKRSGGFFLVFFSDIYIYTTSEYTMLYIQCIHATSETNSIIFLTVWKKIHNWCTNTSNKKQTNWDSNQKKVSKRLAASICVTHVPVFCGWNSLIALATHNYCLLGGVKGAVRNNIAFWSCCKENF